MSVRFRICLIAWIAVLAMTLLSQEAPAQTQELTPVPEEAVPVPVAETLPAVTEPEWQMIIRPTQKLDYVQAAGCEKCDAKTTASDYAKVYASIPFSRAEYNSNPTYRHDATMEILTGNARHKTIVQHNTATRQPPVTIMPASGFSGPQNPSRYGYLRPSLRLNYYKHFPSLNPYVDIWNYSGAF